MILVGSWKTYFLHSWIFLSLIIVYWILKFGLCLCLHLVIKHFSIFLPYAIQDLKYCKFNDYFTLCIDCIVHATVVFQLCYIVFYNDMTPLLLFHLGKSSWSIWLLDILDLEFDWFGTAYVVDANSFRLNNHHSSKAQRWGGLVLATFQYGACFQWSLVNMELVSPIRCSWIISVR